MKEACFEHTQPVNLLVCARTRNTTNRSVSSHTCVGDGCRLQHLKCICEVCVECREMGLQGQQVSCGRGQGWGCTQWYLMQAARGTLPNHTFYLREEVQVVFQ